MIYLIKCHFILGLVGILLVCALKMCSFIYVYSLVNSLSQRTCYLQLGGR